MDDDEEVLIALSETLSTMLDYAGGPQHAEHVLRPLERLCTIEETTVREKVSFLFKLDYSVRAPHFAKSVSWKLIYSFFLQATESIKKVLAMIRIKDFETTIMSMLKRLMSGECYTSKYAAI